MSKQPLAAALALCLAGAIYAAPHTPPFQKIMIVMLENTEFEPAMHQPFLASLAKRGVTLANYHAIGHPSEPNYLALAGGSSFDVQNDGRYDLDAKNLADLLEAHHRTWKVYAEGLPYLGFTGGWSGAYARKHEPFISFKDISGNPQRINHIVPAEQLDKDLADGHLPDYSMYVPDQNDDGHDTTVVFADNWLNKAFGPRLSDPAFMKGMLFVVTFDESDIYTGTNHIATILVGDSVRPGFVSQRLYNHYSMIRMIEDQWGLGNLGKHDVDAPAIDDVWKAPRS